MKLSVVIPAHNEEGCIEGTVRALTSELQQEKIDYEVLVINDNSRDSTEEILQSLAKEDKGVRYLNNRPPNGFGFAVRAGLQNFSGDAVAVYMADASDDPKDLVKFYRKMEQGYDCVFGSRWGRGGRTIDYPWPKKILNRLANTFIQIVMQLRYDDITNAFKLYRREVIEGLQPVISHHFNLTVELPLKAIVRGYSYAVVPNSWTNRKAGESKLKIKEMGSRYLFIVLYCLIEKWLSRQDYHRSTRGSTTPIKKLEAAGVEA
jgi:dolichol-phosphate mannosyltransferase